MNSSQAKSLKEAPAESTPKIPLELGQGNMRTYTSAVQHFLSYAAQFVEHLDCLARARYAHQKAILASAELRAALDAGDQSLHLLLTNMELALSPSIPKPTPRNKEPDTATRDASKSVGEGSSARKRFL